MAQGKRKDRAHAHPDTAVIMAISPQTILYITTLRRGCAERYIYEHLALATPRKYFTSILHGSQFPAGVNGVNKESPSFEARATHWPGLFRIK